MYTFYGNLLQMIIVCRNMITYRIMLSQMTNSKSSSLKNKEWLIFIVVFKAPFNIIEIHFFIVSL